MSCRRFIEYNACEQNLRYWRGSETLNTCEFWAFHSGVVEDYHLLQSFEFVLTAVHKPKNQFDPTCLQLQATLSFLSTQTNFFPASSSTSIYYALLLHLAHPSCLTSPPFPLDLTGLRTPGEEYKLQSSSESNLLHLSQVRRYAVRKPYSIMVKKFHTGGRIFFSVRARARVCVCVCVCVWKIISFLPLVICKVP
jgi:hypothetical protein